MLMKAAVLLALSTALTGCVENDLSLTINKIVAADPGANCTATPQSMFINPSGILDVGIVAAGTARGYVAFPDVKNNLPETTTVGQVEKNAIDVTGLNVELQPSADIAAAVPSALRKFSIQTAAGRLAPGGEVTFNAEIVPRPVALLLANVLQPGATAPSFPTVTVKMAPIGTRSGDDIVGASISMPIQVCKFCLTQAPAACPPTGFKAGTVAFGGCFEAQDTPITCCTTTQNVLLCGHEVPIATM
jgi:hypothetical protein